MEALINDLKAEVLPAGIFIRGNTFSYKEQLKERGAKWNATEKAWVFPVGMDISFLRPPPPPPPPAWVCCSKAIKINFRDKTVICNEHHPEGSRPWWLCGHKNARSLGYHHYACADCPGARPEDGEIYFLRGCLHTGD